MEGGGWKRKGVQGYCQYQGADHLRNRLGTQSYSWKQDFGVWKARVWTHSKAFYASAFCLRLW